MPIDQAQVTKLSTAFDAHKFTLDGVEAWSARDLQGLLGYEAWHNFRYAIQRAMESCARAGRHPARHFVPVDGKIELSPSGVFNGVVKNLKGTKGGRPREDMILSRFAAYLTAMNGDPSKEEVAFAQAYFTVQTRKMEVLEDKLAEIERLRAR